MSRPFFLWCWMEASFILRQQLWQHWKWLLPSSGKGGYNTVWYILIFYKWHMKLLLIIIFNHELIGWDMNKSQGLENAKVTVWIFTFEISIPLIWCSYVQCMNICDIMCCSDFYLRERFLPSCSGGSVLLFGHKQHTLTHIVNNESAIISAVWYVWTLTGIRLKSTTLNVRLPPAGKGSHMNTKKQNILAHCY